MSVATYAECSASERAEAIEQLGALLSATTAELLDVVTAADRAGDWEVDGATGMAPWLVATLRVSSLTAREWVRAGERLDGLPAVREALGDGVLSWDQVRPATSFVDQATDEVLARELQGCSVAQVEALARQHRPRRTAEDEEAARVRRFRWRTDHIAGGFNYTGFLPTEVGELVNQAITRLADSAGPDPATDLWAPFEVRAADALVELARIRIGIDPDPDTCLVVVHADATVIDGHSTGTGRSGTCQSRGRPSCGCCATARSSTPSTDPTAPPSASAAPTATRPAGSAAASPTATAPAASQAAAEPSATATTSNTGPKTAPPTPATSPGSAGNTTTSSTKAAGPSPATPTTSSPSPAPPAAPCRAERNPSNPKYATEPAPQPAWPRGSRQRSN